MAAKSYFAKKELKKYKAALEAKREEIVNNLKNFHDEVKNGTTSSARGDSGDNAAGEIEGNLRLRLQDKNLKLLREIERALEKFADGTYGICEGSEEYISKKRLEIRPWTRYSIEHKEFLDKQRRQRR